MNITPSITYWNALTAGLPHGLSSAVTLGIPVDEEALAGLRSALPALNMGLGKAGWQGDCTQEIVDFSNAAKTNEIDLARRSLYKLGRVFNEIPASQYLRAVATARHAFAYGQVRFVSTPSIQVRVSEILRTPAPAEWTLSGLATGNHLLQPKHFSSLMKEIPHSWDAALAASIICVRSTETVSREMVQWFLSHLLTIPETAFAILLLAVKRSELFELEDIPWIGASAVFYNDSAFTLLRLSDKRDDLHKDAIEALRTAALLNDVAADILARRA